MAVTIDIGYDGRDVHSRITEHDVLPAFMSTISRDFVEAKADN
jgi:hypothetical protein